MSTTSFIISDRVGLFASEARTTVDRLSSRRKYYAYSTLKAPDKGEVGGSSPPRPTIQIISKYAAFLTFPLFGDLPQKTVLSTVCQLPVWRDAIALRAFRGNATGCSNTISKLTQGRDQTLEVTSAGSDVTSRTLLRAQSQTEPARQNPGSGREAEGGGLLIHSDLFVLIDFRLFCLR